MNTSDSVYKRVRPAAEIYSEEAVNLHRHRARRDEDRPGHRVNGTEVYDEMEDVDDPVIVQELPAAGYYAVVREGERFRAAPVECFLAFDDGSIFGADEEGSDLAELPGFQGFVFSDGTKMLSSKREMLSSKRVEQLLEETKIEEVS
jgi:hypothetical protein